MIGEDRARTMAIKFFKEQRLPKYVTCLQGGMCLDGIFQLVLTEKGKSSTLEVWRKLPKQLATYVLVNLAPINAEALVDSNLLAIDKKFPSISDNLTRSRPGRPERLKGWANYRRKLEEVMLNFLKGYKLS